MLDSIKIDKKTKKMFYNFLEDSKKFFNLNSEQKKNYKYTGLTRLDGTADFLKMHDEQPLVRIHKYYKLKEDDYFYTNDDITEDHVLDKLRFFPHRDYGTITLIYQFNDVKGLQIKTWNSKKWTDLSFDSNEIIVMNGMLMEDFGYEPTYHRLMNNDILKERYSMSAHFDLKRKYLGNLTIKERLGIKI